MIHGINNDFLYAVTHLRVQFAKGINKKVFEGSGFFIKKEQNIYLITNRHVVDLEYKDSENKYCSYHIDEVFFDARRFDKTNNKSVTKTYKINTFSHEFAADPYDDIACIYNINVHGDIILTPVTIPYDMLADSDFISQKLMSCDKVALIGFPAGVWDVHNNLPILRSGVISSDPRLDFNNDHNYSGHVIGYEAFSTGGASGSPVFALQKGFPLGGALKAPDDFYRETKLIGINASSVHIGDSHQHMSLMYKSDQIRSLIDHCEEMLFVTAPATKA